MKAERDRRTERWKLGLAIGIPVLGCVLLVAWGIAQRGELIRLREQHAAPRGAPVATVKRGRPPPTLVFTNRVVDAAGATNVVVTGAVGVAATPVGAEWNPDIRARLIRMASETDSKARLAMLGEFGVTITGEDLRTIAAGLPEGYRSHNVLRQIMSQWAEVDHAGALSWCASLGDDEAAVRRVSVAIGVLAQRHPEHVLAWVMEQPEAIRNRTLPMVLRYVAPKDPEYAAALMAASPDAAGMRSVAAHVAMAWADKDVDAAAEWVQSLEPGQARDYAYQRLAQKLAPASPTGAMEWALVIESERIRRSAVSSVVYVWAKHDAAGAGEWVRSLDDERLRETAAQRMVYALGASRPQEAASFIALIGTEHRRVAAASSLVRQWGEKDAVAAAIWVNALEPGKVRDYAAQQLAQSIVSTDPEAAAVWAASIADEDVRRRALRSVERMIEHSNGEEVERK